MARLGYPAERVRLRTDLFAVPMRVGGQYSLF
jgi:hypothetical protein